MTKLDSFKNLYDILKERLPNELTDKIDYKFMVNCSDNIYYCRSCICYMGYDEASFSSNDSYRNKIEIKDFLERTIKWDLNEPFIQTNWNIDARYHQYDFVSSALEFLNLSITEALASRDYVIRILAILDKSIGERTLRRIKNSREYDAYPEWVRQFYMFRFNESIKD